MERHLKLVESDFESLEKRVLPCFPFCYLIFKLGETNQNFEVKDISRTGMQVVLKDGELNKSAEDHVGGTIHWNGKELDVLGQVKWVKENRMGVEFTTQNSLKQDVDKFLDIENLVTHLKPVHQMKNMGFEMPNLLHYWLRADGPVELFVWEHRDGEVAHFQVIIMENFVEWADGKGLQSGRVISKRDIDTPLIHEDEFVFKLDQRVDDARVEQALNLIQKVPTDILESEVKDFLCRKLGR